MVDQMTRLRETNPLKARKLRSDSRPPLLVTPDAVTADEPSPWRETLSGLMSMAGCTSNYSNTSPHNLQILHILLWTLVFTRWNTYIKYLYLWYHKNLPNSNCVLCRCTWELRLSGIGEYKNVQNCTINMYLFLHNAQNTYLLQPRQKYFIGKLHKWWQLIFASLPCSSNPRKTFHIQSLYWALPIMAWGPWTIMVPIWTIWYQ